MFSINSRTCGEGTLTAFAWLEVFHVCRSGVVLIYGGLDTKLIVRQTERSEIYNFGLFFLAKSQLSLRLFSWDNFVFIGLLKAWMSCSLMYILFFCASQAPCIMNYLTPLEQHYHENVGACVEVWFFASYLNLDLASFFSGISFMEVQTFVAGMNFAVPVF